MLKGMKRFLSEILLLTLILTSTPAISLGSAQIPGDCNNDGIVTIDEVQSAINMFLGIKQVASCVDVDGNGSVGISEVQKVINSFLGLYIPTPVSLTSITVTPSNSSIAVGTKQQFTATGTYSDNSTKNLTALVTWSSSSTSVATITTEGNATMVAVGSTTITGASGTIAGTTTLTSTNGSITIYW
jgi:uncharacterized protein YjdB